MDKMDVRATLEAAAKPPASPPAVSEKESELHRLARISRLNLSDIPVCYREYELDDFGDWAERIMDFRRCVAWSLYLHGAVGSGKSCFAGAYMIARRLKIPLNHSYPGQQGGWWLPMHEVAQRIRNVEDWGIFRERWAECSFIVIDDIGASRDTPWLTEQLTQLLLRRFERSLQTILTSNLDLAGLAEAVDPRVASRLQQGVVLDTGITDLRRGPEEERTDHGVQMD